MPKATIEYVDKDFNSLKKIKDKISLDDEQFKAFQSDARRFSEANQEKCKPVPRLYNKELWKNITKEFMDNDDLGAKYWSDDREGFEEGEDLSWEEDKDDIRFLAFCVLKWEIKNVIDNKRKSGDGNAEDETSTPKAKRAKKNPKANRETSSPTPKSAKKKTAAKKGGSKAGSMAPSAADDEDAPTSADTNVEDDSAATSAKQAAAALAQEADAPIAEEQPEAEDEETITIESKAAPSKKKPGRPAKNPGVPKPKSKVVAKAEAAAEALLKKSEDLDKTVRSFKDDLAAEDAMSDEAEAGIREGWHSPVKGPVAQSVEPAEEQPTGAIDPIQQPVTGLKPSPLPTPEPTTTTVKPGALGLDSPAFNLDPNDTTMNAFSRLLAQHGFHRDPYFKDGRELTPADSQYGGPMSHSLREARDIDFSVISPGHEVTPVVFTMSSGQTFQHMFAEAQMNSSGSVRFDLAKSTKAKVVMPGGATVDLDFMDKDSLRMKWCGAMDMAVAAVGAGKLHEGEKVIVEMWKPEDKDAGK